MGNNNVNSDDRKNVNDVRGLIKLKNGNFACSYYKDNQVRNVIEIFSRDLKTELIINIYYQLSECYRANKFNNNEGLMQLKNGKLFVQCLELDEIAIQYVLLNRIFFLMKKIIELNKILMICRI